ncbi:hypothetical protein CCAX7_11150 [Capsulimonas corticalis]|uniref:Uncharacterized protein n=2 Tax=Capsulimonas corticalis TaxID=2219043 RepID=A0A402CUS4_9BACT|nr:hypothetical protein CCAX7_11150 [Capsulimonas corticalis]
MIGLGAEVNYSDNGLVTPLIAAVSSGKQDIAELLLRHGANINQKVAFGFTPLRCAVTQNNSMVCMLLQHGAQVNTQDNQGNTPLNIACMNLDADIVKSLLQYHANPNIVNYKGQTPLISVVSASSDAPHAEKNGDIMDDLLRAGANVKYHDKEGNSARTLAFNNHHLDLITRLDQYRRGE